MLNGKYGKLLTIILILAIVAIIGLLIFIGIDWYKTYTTGAETNDMMEQFNSYINNIQQEENNSNVEDNVTELNTINNEQDITPIIPEENIVDKNNQINNDNSSSNQAISYKGFNMIGKIRIPKTGLQCPVLEEASPKAIEIAIGKMYGPGINEVGNTVLIGHNFKNGTFFSDNKKLSVGDKIYLTDTKGNEVEYVITKKYTTTVEDFDYAVRDTKGKREVSLSTCTDDTKSRLIIWAEET